MTVIDITERIRTGSFYEMIAIREWLTDHVGEYLGRGRDHVVDYGTGWEIRILHDLKSYLPGWCVDISDERLAMLFTLRWA